METEIREKLKVEDAMLLSLKMEYQLPRQGMQAASKLERQLSGFSPSSSRGVQASETRFKLLTSKAAKHCVVLGH